MLKLLKAATTILMLVAALLVSNFPVRAEQLNTSVKECIENPESCKESQSVKTQKGTEASNQDIGVTFWDFLRMILATVFVVGLLYFLLKFINKKGATYKSSQIVENLGGTSLGANRSVQIIRVGNRMYIVGVGENIQLLSEIKDPEEFDQIIQQYNDKVDQIVQPSDIVTKIKNSMMNSRISEGSSFSTVLKKQLEDMSSGRKKMLDEIQKKGSDDK